MRKEQTVQMELEAPTNDLIAMNLTIATLEQWLKNVNSERRGSELGREIAAMYREIHAAVDEMSPGATDDFEVDDEECSEEDEDDETLTSDERD